MTTWRLLFSDGGIKAEMMSPPWNNFLRSLLRFVVVRFGHDEGLGRIIFRSVFGDRKKKKEDIRKKKILNSAYRNVGRCSLGIYSQAIRRVFACAVIHTAKHLTG
jgi:hypothetical protein